MTMMKTKKKKSPAKGLAAVTRPKNLSSDHKRLHGFEYLIKWAARDPRVRRFTVSLAFELNYGTEGPFGTLPSDPTKSKGNYNPEWYPMYRVAIWSSASPKIVWTSSSTILYLAAETAIGRSGMKD